MMVDKNANQLIESVVRSWEPGTRIRASVALTPDASTRRYYRIDLVRQTGTPTSVIAMVFHGVAAAEVGSGEKVNADQAYVELTHFLRHHHVPVPELYHDARDVGVLLIEDLGSRHLSDVVLGKSSGQSVATHLRYFESAIREIVRLQRIPSKPNFFPYTRTFNRDLYFREMTEFRDYVMPRPSMSTDEVSALEHCFSALAEELDRAPRVLAHRDFHSWNLLIDPSEKVRIIDFQDALQATRTYDVVALLNDRDIDGALGHDACEQLFDFFERELSLSESLVGEYRRVLLQRDLKVAGRFMKLSKERGLRQYEVWVPGTLRRIERTLIALQGEARASSAFGELRRVISGHLQLNK